MGGRMKTAVVRLSDAPFGKMSWCSIGAGAVWSRVVTFYCKAEAAFFVIFRINGILPGLIYVGCDLITMAKRAVEFNEILTPTVQNHLIIKIGHI
jgi:hypothetical protein